MTHIFISYRVAEKDFALKLAEDLRKSGTSIWMDRLSGIKLGDDWIQSIQDAINSCVGMIAVLSPAYVKSKYCNLELSRAAVLNCPIFPLLLEDLSRAEMPLLVQNLQYVDFRDSSAIVYESNVNELVMVLQQKGIFLAPSGGVSVTGSDLASPPPIKILEDSLDKLDALVEGLPIKKTSVRLKTETLRKRLQIDRKDYEDVSEMFFTLVDPELKNALERKLERLLKDIDRIEAEFITAEQV